MSSKIWLSGKNGRGQFTTVDEDVFLLLSRYKWFLSHNGYATTGLGKFTRNKRLGQVLMHRLILAPPIEMEIDHIDNDKLNNRKKNLRICTRKQNLQNRPKMLRINGRKVSSKYKGVYWQKDISRWRARISTNGKSIYLGTFEDEVKAAMEYNKAAKRYYKDFAFLNKIEGGAYEQ